VLEVIIEIEVRFDFGRLEPCPHLGIGLEQGQEVAFAFPDLHRVLLHQAVGVFARHALLRQRD